MSFGRRSTRAQRGKISCVDMANYLELAGSRTDHISYSPSQLCLVSYFGGFLSLSPCVSLYLLPSFSLVDIWAGMWVESRGTILKLNTNLSAF